MHNILLLLTVYYSFLIVYDGFVFRCTRRRFMSIAKTVIALKAHNIPDKT
jgi:hypothetical protein